MSDNLAFECIPFVSARRIDNPNSNDLTDQTMLPPRRPINSPASIHPKRLPDVRSVLAAAGFYALSSSIFLFGCTSEKQQELEGRVSQALGVVQNGSATGRAHQFTDEGLVLSTREPKTRGGMLPVDSTYKLLLSERTQYIDSRKEQGRAATVSLGDIYRVRGFVDDHTVHVVAMEWVSAYPGRPYDANEALEDAIRSRSLSGVKDALAKGANASHVAPPGIPVLVSAAGFAFSQPFPEVVSFLLESGADVNAVAKGFNATALGSAMSHCNKYPELAAQTAEVLLEHGATPDSRKMGFDACGRVLTR